MARYLKDKAVKQKIKKLESNKPNKGKNSDLLDENANDERKSFASLKDLLTEGTMKAIEDMGFKTMTEIQEKTIPKLLECYDVRATAKTGSGKTLAFLIPVVELIVKIHFKPQNGTGAIIISPTRELALQIYGVLTDLMKYHNQTFNIVLGGTEKKREAQKLSKGVNILVATPGRLLDHLKNAPFFNYKNLSCLVIDEADRIFSFGFQEQMREIVQLIPSRRQTMLFSATKDHRSECIAQIFLKKKPVEIDIQIAREEVTTERLEQAYMLCPREKKFLFLFKFIKKYHKSQKIMVFFSSALSVAFYHSLLNFVSIPVVCMHGKQDDGKRLRNFFQFKREKSGVLLCTNICSRGLDFPAVHWIVQYDPPDDPKEYIHRVGRTARAGEAGKALLLLTEEELDYVRILMAYKVKLDYMEILWPKISPEIQKDLEDIVGHNKHLKGVARDAFIASFRAYESHSLKKIFDINKLDVNKLARCFLLPYTPEVSAKNSSIPYNKKPPPVKRKQDFDYGTESEERKKSNIIEASKERKGLEFTEESKEKKRPKITIFDD